MGLGGGPKPKPPQAPPKPPAPILMEDPSVRQAKELELQRRAKSTGRRSTILAGASENTQRRQTLGGA